MAINVYKGAKFFFDITFSIPDPFDHTDFRIEDVIPAGFSLMAVTPASSTSPEVLDVEITPVVADERGIPLLNDEGNVTLDGPAPQFKATRDTDFVPGQDTLFVSEIKPLTAGKTYILTLAVEVTNQELAAAANLNTAKFYVDGNVDPFEDEVATFTAEKARLSFFGKSSILEAKDGATSALTYELGVFNDHSEQDYIITVNLDEAVQDGEDFPFIFSKHLSTASEPGVYYVKGFRKGDDGNTSMLVRGSDFDVTPDTGNTLKEITVHATDNTRGHRLYFALGIKYDSTAANVGPIRPKYHVEATVEFDPEDVQDTLTDHLVIIEQPLTVNPKKLVR